VTTKTYFISFGRNLTFLFIGSIYGY